MNTLRRGAMRYGALVHPLRYPVHYRLNRKLAWSPHAYRALLVTDEETTVQDDDVDQLNMVLYLKDKHNISGI